MKSLTQNQASILDAAAAKYAKADLATEVSLGELVAKIKGAGITDHKACSPKLMEHIAKARGIVLVDKERGQGKTWPEAAEGLAGGKSALTRALKAIAGEAHSPKDELEIPANILTAAKALVKLCAEYEGAAKVRAAAIALALTK